MSEHRSISVGAYTVVFVVLMILLALTMAASFIKYDEFDLSALGVAIALLIAFAKAILVVTYFMHVKISSKLTKIFVVSGILWLGIMFTLTYSDYLTRGWLPAERGWAQKAIVPKP